MKLAQASTVGSRFLDPSAPAEESTFYARIYADIESTLRAHLPTFTEQLFEQASSIVDGARMIYVFGMGGASAVLAQERRGAAAHGSRHPGRARCGADPVGLRPDARNRRRRPHRQAIPRPHRRHHGRHL
ncbi:hypothetical protein G6F65_021265 [Rhizopus arrhizus]|nr:hypothetical protein G6F65_021265 [Rhizopus arrhizus]